MFKERPVWTLNAIQNRLESAKVEYGSSFSLKKTLSDFTYLFKNGPWKFTYVRFGYDPRKDKKSLFYQTFNLGIKNSNFLNSDENGNNNNSKSNNVDLKQRLFHKVQVCDVEDFNIKEMLNYIEEKNNREYHKLFNKKYGWMEKKQYLFISKRLKTLIKNNLCKIKS